MGTSKNLPLQENFYGVMSDNHYVNPDFCDWNMVLIHYCDGAAFSGRPMLQDNFLCFWKFKYPPNDTISKYMCKLFLRLGKKQNKTKHFSTIMTIGMSV